LSFWISLFCHINPFRYWITACGRILKPLLLALKICRTLHFVPLLFR